MYAGGSVIGLSVGGTIINNYGWHATFFSIVPISIALWFIIRRVIHDRKLEGEEEEERKGQLLHQTPKSGTTSGVETEFCVACGKVVATVVVPTLDLKGVITLAIAITSFLLTLTSFSILFNTDHRCFCRSNYCLIGFICDCGEKEHITID